MMFILSQLHCIIDTTSFTPISPPKMNITIIPGSLNLRQGEEESV